MYIKTLNGNPKRGARDVLLGQHTLIVGRNGSGKSSLIAVLTLAMGGWAELRGKSRERRQGELIDLAPALEGKLWADATLGSGEVCSWYTTGEEGRAKRPTMARPKALEGVECFPLHSIVEAMGGRPETFRAQLLRAVQSSPRDAMPSAYHTLYDDLYAQTTADQSSYARHAEVVALARRRATLHKREHERLRKAIMVCRSTVVEPASVREAARAALGQAQSRVLTLANKCGGYTQNGAGVRIEHRLTALIALIAAAPTQAVGVRVLTAIELKINRDLVNIRARLTALTHISSRFAEGTGPCQLCGGDVADRAGAATAFMANIKAATQQVTDATQASADVQVANKRLGVVLRSVLEEEKTALEALRPHVDALRAARWQMRKEASAVESQARNVATFAEADAHEAADAHAVKAQRAYSDLVEAATEATMVLINQARKELETSVKARLPQGYNIGIILQQGSREVCRIGLWRVVPCPQCGTTSTGTTCTRCGGSSTVRVLHTALCGAELGIIIPALASVLTPASHPCPVYVLDGGVLDGMGAFDPETLATLLEGLAAAPGQWIITSPVPPARKIAGWTLVQRGAVAQAATPAPAPALDVLAPSTDPDLSAVKNARHRKVILAVWRAASKPTTKPTALGIGAATGAYKSFGSIRFEQIMTAGVECGALEVSSTHISRAGYVDERDATPTEDVESNNVVAFPAPDAAFDTSELKRQRAPIEPADPVAPADIGEDSDEDPFLWVPPGAVDLTNIDAIDEIDDFDF